MRQIYKTIWKMAEPYYKKGRPTDIEHIKWMMKQAFMVCKKENIDEELLLSLVILHDCGYAVSKKGDPYKLSLRKEHMKKGAKIAKKILDALDYADPEKNKIVKYISVHDNWALGNHRIYKKDKILGVFNDLDFIWMASPEYLRYGKKFLGENLEEKLEFLKYNEKLKNRPFCTDTTRKLFYYYLNKNA